MVNWLKRKKQPDGMVGIFFGDEEDDQTSAAPAAGSPAANPNSLSGNFEQKRDTKPESKPVSQLDLSRDNFPILSDLLKNKFGGAELKQVMKPVAVAFDDKGDKVEVAVKGHAHSFTVAKNSVQANVAQGGTLTAESADKLAELSKTTGTNGKPAVLKGNDEQKILLFLAAQKHGIEVKNAAEIQKLQKTNPELVNKVMQSWMTHQAKQTFDLPVGEIASRLGVIEEKERARAGLVQADLVAISLKRPKDDKTDLFGLMRNDDARKAKIEELGITSAEMSAARQIASTQGRGVPNDVPKFFMIAKTEEVDRNLIFQAQADVRALSAIDRIKAGHADAMPDNDYETMFSMVGKTRPGQKADPDFVVHAQGRNATVHALETSVAKGAELSATVLAIHERSALQSLLKAADGVAQRGHAELANAMRLVAQTHIAPAAPAPGGEPPRPGAPA